MMLSAAIMAAVAAEQSDSLGVLLTTRGPGLANGANGVNLSWTGSAGSASGSRTGC